MFDLWGIGLGGANGEQPLASEGLLPLEDPNPVDESGPDDWSVAGARLALSVALAATALTMSVSGALARAGGDVDVPAPSTTTPAGGGGAESRALILNAGFKQPRQPIATDDEFPTSIVAIALDDDGFTARVRWAPPVFTPPITADEEFRPVVDEAEGWSSLRPFSSPWRSIVSTDDEEAPTAAPAFVPDEDGGAVVPVPWPVARVAAIAADDEVEQEAPPPSPAGGGSAGPRALILNAGWKQPRAPIATDDEIPTPAAVVALDDDGFTARVRWAPPVFTPPITADEEFQPVVDEAEGWSSLRPFSSPWRSRVSTDDEEAPTAAPAFVPDEDGGAVVPVPWPVARVAAIATDDEVEQEAPPPSPAGGGSAGPRALILNAGWKQPRAPIATDDEIPTSVVAVALDEDFSIPRVGTPADFAVPHPTGFGAADESITSTLEEHDHFLPAAPWPVRTQRAIVGIEDELPSAVAPTFVEEELGPTRRPWAIVPPRAVLLDDDAPPPPALDDADSSPLRAWPAPRLTRAQTADEEWAPRPIAFEEDCTVSRVPWAWWRPAQAFRGMGVDRVSSVAPAVLGAGPHRAFLVPVPHAAALQDVAHAARLTDTTHAAALQDVAHAATLTAAAHAADLRS